MSYLILERKMERVSKRYLCPKNDRCPKITMMRRLCIRNLCLGHTDAAGKMRKRQDWTCESTKTRKNENATLNMWKHESAKTRKRCSRFLVFSFWWLHLSGQLSQRKCARKRNKHYKFQISVLKILNVWSIYRHLGTLGGKCMYPLVN